MRLVVALTQAHGPTHALTQRAHVALERAYAAELTACAPFLAADDHPALDHVIASYVARAARRRGRRRWGGRGWPRRRGGGDRVRGAAAHTQAAGGVTRAAVAP